MTILLDYRIGSKELLPHFKPYDVPVELSTLDFGDLAFWGNGHDGPVLVGIELKNISDLVSSMRSNRLSGHQLPGLMNMYGFVIVIVQGIWQCGKNGEVETIGHGGKWWPLRIGSRPVLYREVDHYLATLEHRCGIVVKYTSNAGQTAAFVISRYHWWNDKDWHKHDSHEAIYNGYQDRVTSRRGSFVRRTVGPVEQVASTLPGIDRKAYEFGKRFKCVRDLVNATEKELEQVDGVGKKGAKRIVEWLSGNGG
jgi:ERCC4-type nuclease